MKDLFNRSARLKLGRARHHIQQLNTAILRFRKDHPQEVVSENDIQSGYKIYKLRLPKPTPLQDFSLFVGDTITNLRSALDHTIWAIATIDGATPQFRACNFPFGSDATKFANAINGCKGVPQEIRALLGTFEAHPGGNAALWMINKMSNWDKHALVTPVFAGFDSSTIKVAGVIIPSEHTRYVGVQSQSARWIEAKDHIELELLRTDQNATCDIAFTLDIAFDDPPYLNGNRVVPVLRNYADVTEHVVHALEMETRRIFPNRFD